jgi:hypothetical protein
MERGWRMRLDARIGTQISVGLSRAKRSGGGDCAVVKCLSVNELRFAWGWEPALLDEWRRASGRSELWDRREQGKRIRMGAQALVGAREALRPYELFVSPGGPERAILLKKYARQAQVQ